MTRSAAIDACSGIFQAGVSATIFVAETIVSLEQAKMCPRSISSYCCLRRGGRIPKFRDEACRGGKEIAAEGNICPMSVTSIIDGMAAFGIVRAKIWAARRLRWR